MHKINKNEQKSLQSERDRKQMVRLLDGKQGVKVGTTEKISGSVTTHYLCDAVKAQSGVQID